MSLQFTMHATIPQNQAFLQSIIRAMDIVGGFMEQRVTTA